MTHPSDPGPCPCVALANGSGQYVKSQNRKSFMKRGHSDGRSTFSGSVYTVSRVYCRSDIGRYASYQSAAQKKLPLTKYVYPIREDCSGAHSLHSFLDFSCRVIFFYRNVTGLDTCERLSSEQILSCSARKLQKLSLRFFLQ